MKVTNFPPPAMLIVALLLPSSAAAIEIARELYVVRSKPPAVAILDTAQWTVSAEIPILPGGNRFLPGPGARSLYVIHGGGGLKPDGILEIVDLARRQTAGQYALGRDLSFVRFSADQRLLILYTRGRLSPKHKNQLPPQLTIVDTATNRVSASRPGQYGHQLLVSADGSKLFTLTAENINRQATRLASASPVLGFAALRGKQAVAQGSILKIFAVGNDKPLSELPVGASNAMAFSRDQKWLYLFEPGQLKRKSSRPETGTVRIVDVGAATIKATHQLGFHPSGPFADPNADTVTFICEPRNKRDKTMLYQFRAGDLLGPEPVDARLIGVLRPSGHSSRLLVGFDALRVLRDDGTLANNVPLRSAAMAHLGGPPQDLISLGTDKVAVSTFGKHQVAIVDLNRGVIDQVVPTGRGSVRKGKAFGRIAASVALSAASYGAFSSLGSPGYLAFFPGSATNRRSLASSGEGQYIYALETESNDVTIIRSTDGTVVAKIPVGSAQFLIPAPGGKYVCAYDARNLYLIDTGTHKLTKHTIESETIATVQADTKNRLLFVATNKSVRVWDASTGQSAGSASFANARRVITPVYSEEDDVTDHETQ